MKGNNNMANTKRKSSSKRSINDSISKKISSKTGIKKEYVSKNVRQVYNNIDNSCGHL